MAGLSEKTYQILKEKLRGSEPGVFYSVRKCAGELNISYTPVREALLRLTSEGFLELVPNVGFFVKNLDMRAVVDIFQSRDCVEKYVLPLVVPALTAEDMAELRRIVEEQSAALEASDFSEYARRDMDFHCRIVDRLGNHELYNFYKSIRERYMFCSNNIVQTRDNYAVVDHTKFIDAVEAGEHEAACAIILGHTQSAFERIKAGYTLF